MVNVKVFFAVVCILENNVLNRHFQLLDKSSFPCLLVNSDLLKTCMPLQLKQPISSFYFLFFNSPKNHLIGHGHILARIKTKKDIL